MIVGSRMPVIYDQWEEKGFKYRLASRGDAPAMVEVLWTAGGWQPLESAEAERLLIRRLMLRVNLNNVEARRISFLAAALMRCLQLAEKLIDDAPGGMTRLTRGHLAAVKGVLLACRMPLERWQVELDGVEEDPETAEARRRLGLDVKTQMQ